MSTGFEALGAASAVLQVISFARDLIVTCKGIYDGKLTSEENLERHAQQMSDAVDRVQIRCEVMAKLHPQVNNNELQAIAKACKESAQELKKEARFVTGLCDKRNLLHAIHATLRGARHRKKIELLE
ncbi:hypothetical protein FOMG_19722, partial [Fusarium oxysporum f. sp. melonis 26406]